jgi:hypothetical protein
MHESPANQTQNQRAPARSLLAWVAIVGACILALTFPLVIPAEWIIARAITCFFCIEVFLKTIDYARECYKTTGFRWRDYAFLLIPFPMLLVTWRDKQRTGWTSPTPAQAAQIALCAAGMAGIMWLVSSMTTWTLLQRSFALVHAVKLFLFVMLVEIGSRCMQLLEQLAGYDIPPLMQRIYLARTVGEFWSRLNTRVHRWLRLNVFEPAAGRRYPVRGLLLTFGVSAAFHEWMFDIATSHVDGYQFAFFFLQAPAIMVSYRLERWTRRYGLWGDALTRAATILWFYFSSMLFFRGVERVFPIMYASESWLP